MATLFPASSPFSPGPALAPRVPDPFEIAARRFEQRGAEAYLYDPVGFARDCILWPPGEAPTAYQDDIWERLVRRRRVAVRGPHGLGKSALAGIAIAWFAITREAARLDWKCVTTAGSWHQLEHYLWPEVHKWVERVDWGRLEMDPWRPDRELLRLNLKLRHGSAFAAASTRVELIEGAHADHILFVFDEAKAIAPDTFDAAEGALAGDEAQDTASTGGKSAKEAYALTMSTPGPPQGRFYDIHKQKPGLEDWDIRHVTKHEAINAKRISAAWAEQRRRQWGEQSSTYQNRVEGEFWSTDEDVVIPVSWIEAANERWDEWVRNGRRQAPGRRIFGVDVARGGTDLTVIAERQGPIVELFTRFQVADTTKVATRVKRKMAHQTDLCVVDVIGVGAGVVDLLRRWGLTTHAFNASRKSRRRDRTGEFGFKNQRAAMWWMMREALDPAFDPVLAIPVDDDLLGELSAPKWKDVGGKIIVESKDALRTRLGRSTDTADAVCQTLLTDLEFNEAPASEGPGHFLYENGDPDDGVFSWN